MKLISEQWFSEQCHPQLTFTEENLYYQTVIIDFLGFYADLEDAKTKLTTLNKQLELKEADVDRYSTHRISVQD